MARLSSIRFILLFSLSLTRSTQAYPTGAGGCGGSGSVGGIHLSADSFKTGQLIDYGLKVHITPQDESLLDEDPEVQLSNGYVKNVLKGRPYHIQLSAPSEDKGFRGFLFRITSSIVDRDGSFSVPDTLSDTEKAQVQLAQVCEDIGIGGMTHTNNTLKAQADAVLLLDEEGRDLFMEITAVIMNRQENGVTESEYYWDTYTINVVTDSSDLAPATNSPVVAPDTGTDGEESGAASSTSMAYIVTLLSVLPSAVAYEYL